MVAASTFLSGILGGAGSNSSYEPQRVNGALLYINNIGNGGVDQVFTLSLKSFPLPKFSISPVMAGYLNEKRKFAGNPEFDDLSVTLYDLIDLGTLDTLMSWMYQVYDPRTGQKGLKKNYAKSGFVRVFAPDGSMERSWNLYGVWPGVVDPGESDQNGDDLIQVTTNLIIDKAIAADGFTIGRAFG